MVRWRDVNCGDEDDYEVLWSREWLGEDILYGDDAFKLPEARPALTENPAVVLSRYVGKVLKSEEVQTGADEAMIEETPSVSRLLGAGEPLLNA